jgi:hypothetical protein
MPAGWLVPKQSDGIIGWGFDESFGFGIRYFELRVSEPDRGPIRGVQAEHTLLGWQAGWPAKALWCGAKFDAFVTQMKDVRGGLEPPLWMHPKFRDQYPSTVPYLPLLPTAFGFAIDVALYTAIAFGLSCAATGIRGVLRRKAHRCPACGYDRRGLVGGADAKCPECGSVSSGLKP